MKWTLRSVSGIAVPDVDGPETDPKKLEALKDGIKKIEDFGKGIGYHDPDGSVAKMNLGFLENFKSLLSRNGVWET